MKGAGVREGQPGQEGQEGVGGGGHGGAGGAGGSSDSLRTPKLIIVGCLIVIVGSLIGTIMYTSHISSDRRAEQVAGCERANQQRAYINKIIEHHPDFELPPIPIPVCEDIIK